MARQTFPRERLQWAKRDREAYIPSWETVSMPYWPISSARTSLFYN